MGGVFSVLIKTDLGRHKELSVTKDRRVWLFLKARRVIRLIDVDQYIKAVVTVWLVALAVSAVNLSHFNVPAIKKILGTQQDRTNGVVRINYLTLNLAT